MKDPIFDYGILGAGAIGCYTRGWLGLQHRVLLIGRPRYMEAVQSSGLRLESADRKKALLAGRAFFEGDRKAGEGAPSGHTVYLSTSAESLKHCRVVLVAVKSGATEEAAAEIQRWTDPDVPVISLQNGLHASRVLRQKLPNHAVIPGMVTFNVISDSGLFQQSTTGPIVLQESPISQRVQKDLQKAGIQTDPRSDMESVQWSKLLLNLNNPVNALAGIPIRSMLSDRGYRRIIAAAMKEAMDIYGQANIKTVRLGKILPGIAPMVLGLPDILFFRVASTMINIDPTAMTSLAQDLISGRKTEIDYLNGEIVRLAKSMKKTAPINERLCALVHEAEKAGGSPYMVSTDLARALQLSPE